ncbi:MAG: excinuclease ABC subunit UvrC [Candidatus Omnitrophota bacterium]|nr:MAG: excinuclease ABC subunit UvrC [Candidatus Omnitrophota bacterium]
MANLKEKIKKLPLTAGVYIMKSKKGEVLYVGKASSLRKRVVSYFRRGRSRKTEILVDKIADIDFIECESEAQALILEASLIKEKMPKYNIALRDDKSYPYVEITKEKFPRLRVSRPKGKTKSMLFGPYPNAGLLKMALKMIRRIFPYCSCRRWPKSACLFYHLNLCPGPCIGAVLESEYRENIEGICKVLKGERKELIEDLEQKMKEFSRKNKFEEAALLRDKILAIRNLYRGRGKMHELLFLKDVVGLAHPPLVIEAIDISSLSGGGAAGSVVVFRNAIPDKNSYRRYRIKEARSRDDYAMIAEVVRRRYSRLLEEKKKLPDLILIDGGKGHVERAKIELDRLGVSVAVIGIAKRNEELWFPKGAGKKERLVIPKDDPSLHLIQRIRDEAHRFAHKYHLLCRKKKMTEKND